MSGPGMTIRSNRFCAWTDVPRMHANRAATAAYRTGSRKSPAFRSVKMDSDNMYDRGRYEKEEQWHMQHMPQREQPLVDAEARRFHGRGEVQAEVLSNQRDSPFPSTSRPSVPSAFRVDRGFGHAHQPVAQQGLPRAERDECKALREKTLAGHQNIRLESLQLINKARRLRRVFAESLFQYGSIRKDFSCLGSPAIKASVHLAI